MAGLLACSLALGPVGCQGTGMSAPPGVLVVSQEQQASWLRNFNPLNTTGGARWPSSAGIYEPLMIYNSVAGEWTPWLATDYAWAEAADGLTVTVREGVRWSDGEAFTARDVAFTFNLVLKNPTLDTMGLSDFLVSVAVEEEDPRVVRFVFSRPFVPGLPRLAHLPIVPEHVWSGVDDPVTFTNPEPVGTGPFTEIRLFTPQVWELGRNPHYWQPGVPAVEALRFPALPTNDQANLALINGELDWAGNFVPAIDRIFVSRDPDNRGYWFPVVGGTVLLVPNATHPALQDPTLRRALSLAIDRPMVVKIAMYDYSRPSDGTGLSDGFREWKDPAALADGDWVDFDPARAGALLEEAGWRMGPDGLRLGPDGEPLTLELNTVAGWSDWVRAAQVIVRNLQDVGIDAKLKSYDFSAWFERLTRGEFDLSLAWSQESPTPYAFYQGLMSARSVKPIGESAASNWHRYSSPEMDVLLDAFEGAAEPTEQRSLAVKMQRLFAAEAPAIPLFPTPSWGEYNSERFTGWPTAADPYARLSPNHPPETLLVMTRVKPRAPAPSLEPSR